MNSKTERKANFRKEKRKKKKKAENYLQHSLAWNLTHK